MLLESMIDHEYPLAMRMEAEAPMVGPCCIPAPCRGPTLPCVASARSHWLSSGMEMVCVSVPPPPPSPPVQLIEMSLEEMEMPGQHLPAPDAPDMVYVDRLSSNIQVVRRNSNSCRRIALHGSDGSLRTFLVQSSQVRSWPALLGRTQAYTMDQAGRQWGCGGRGFLLSTILAPP